MFSGRWFLSGRSCLSSWVDQSQMPGSAARPRALNLPTSTGVQTAAANDTQAVVLPVGVFAGARIVHGQCFPSQHSVWPLASSRKGRKHSAGTGCWLCLYIFPLPMPYGLVTLECSPLIYLLHLIGGPAQCSGWKMSGEHSSVTRPYGIGSGNMYKQSQQPVPAECFRPFRELASGQTEC